MERIGDIAVVQFLLNERPDFFRAMRRLHE